MLVCCAFAVFLLHQLLLPFGRLRRWLGGKADARPNAAVIWRPGARSSGATRSGAAGLRTSAKPLVSRPAMAMVLAVELLAIGGSVAAATFAARSPPGSPEQQVLNALHADICRAVGRPSS